MSLVGHKNFSVAGVSTTILSEIGRRALGTKIGRWAVIIREGTGNDAWSIIVLVADGVGQRVDVQVSTRLRLARDRGQCRQSGRGQGELQWGHRSLRRRRTF